MRLIDADALKADYGMKDDCADCEKELQGKVRSCEYDRTYSKMDFCGWIDDAPTIEQPTVAYLCDKKKCGEKCSAMEGICNHTFDVRHAVNFIEIHGVFVEGGDA